MRKPSRRRDLHADAALSLRDRWTMAVLVALAVAAWAFVLRAPMGMGVSVAVFLGAWTAMMAAMMLPSVMPLVLLYAHGARPSSTAALVAGYLGVWAVAGVPAWLAQEMVPMSAAPLALAVAGLYQLTPAKQACLRKCRGPADFLMQRWGRGAFLLGLEHGAWCLGCCWALMAVLVVVGMMGLAWVIGLAAIVAAEKLTRHGVLLSRVTGAAMLVAAIVQGVM